LGCGSGILLDEKDPVLEWGKCGKGCCDKLQDEPLQVTDRGAGRMALTKGRVKVEGVVDCKVK